MNAVFKLMVFSIVLNFAVGIMVQALPGFGGDENIDKRAGLNYSSSYTTNFVSEMNSTINPTGQLEDSNRQTEIFDFLQIGFIGKFLNTIKMYIYGFIYYLDVLFGSSLDSGMRKFLFGFPFGLFYSLMNVGYMIGAWRLWTGNRLATVVNK